MSVFRIMIVEDDELTASKMEMQIDKLGHELFKWVKNSELAILALEQQQPDLILMDINIEGEYDGIELTDMIHQQWNIPIVFVSSLQDNYTFKRIKRTNPIAFIQKPFSAIQLQRTIELAIEQLQTTQERPYDISNAIAQQKQEYIFIKKRKQLEKVKIADIFYIESDGKYAQIYMVNKKYLVRMSLREIMNLLNSSKFIQTHRSFIVNMDKIKSVDLEDYMIVLENMQIPISRREREVVLDRLTTLT